MKTIKKITAVLAIILGVVFLFAGGSDIQLGSGAILVAVGVLGL